MLSCCKVGFDERGKQEHIPREKKHSTVLEKTPVQLCGQVDFMFSQATFSHHLTNRQAPTWSNEEFKRWLETTKTQNFSSSFFKIINEDKWRNPTSKLVRKFAWPMGIFGLHVGMELKTNKLNYSTWSSRRYSALSTMKKMMVEGIKKDNAKSYPVKQGHGLPIMRKNIIILVLIKKMKMSLGM